MRIGCICLYYVFFFLYIALINGQLIKHYTFDYYDIIIHSYIKHKEKYANIKYLQLIVFDIYT